jgi:hypothetical protein
VHRPARLYCRGASEPNGPGSEAAVPKRSPRRGSAGACVHQYGNHPEAKTASAAAEHVGSWQSGAPPFSPSSMHTRPGVTASSSRPSSSISTGRRASTCSRLPTTSRDCCLTRLPLLLQKRPISSISQTERRRSRTYAATGYAASPVWRSEWRSLSAQLRASQVSSGRLRPVGPLRRAKIRAKVPSEREPRAA